MMIELFFLLQMVFSGMSIQGIGLAAPELPPEPAPFTAPNCATLQAEFPELSPADLEDTGNTCGPIMPARPSDPNDLD